LSKGSISQLETGFDRRTGKPIEPSPRALRMIAAALAEGDDAQTAAFYREMMDLAGYLPHEYFPDVFGPTPVPSAFAQAFGPERQLADTPGVVRIIRDIIDLSAGLEERDALVLLDVALALARRSGAESPAPS
jgi:hypothetical protein